MLTVKQLSRAEIDAWPIAESGLPARVVNSTRTAHIMTVGQLRAWKDADLLQLRSLGRISLGHIRGFFQLCRQVEQGKQQFQAISDVLDIFLDAPGQAVLLARYGFSQGDMRPSRNAVTLQEIGNAQQKTRERVRQIEESAKHRLRSKLAWVCLEPFYAHASHILRATGGVASASDLLAFRDDVALAGYNPSAVFLLMHDLAPARMAYYRGFFGTIPEENLVSVEESVLEILEATHTPTTLDQIARALASPARPSLPRVSERVLTVLLDHCPGVTGTGDNRYFLRKQGIQDFLVELLRPMTGPVHYRTVTDAYNERVKPGCRKGAGYILDILNGSTRFVRADRGLYDLA